MNSKAFSFFLTLSLAAMGAWLSVPEVPAQDHKAVAVKSNGKINSPRQTRRLESIKIFRHDPETEITEKTFDAAVMSSFNMDLELGESIENQVISLQPFAGDSREFKVEQQFETSMAIGDEGPHVDLVNWKHYTSDWKEIEHQGGNRFLTVRVTEVESRLFPTVTSREIYKVVLKEGGKRWGALSLQCKTPFDGPCYVGVSRISIRISANENGQWKEIHRINFSIPLGC